jgi:hypothetical protein
MKRFEYVGYLLAVVIILVWVGGALVGQMLTEPPSEKITQDDLERNVAWQIQNRNEYRRKGAADRRKEMQDRARVEAQQDDAWKVMDESLGLKQPSQPIGRPYLGVASSVSEVAAFLRHVDRESPKVTAIEPDQNTVTKDQVIDGLKGGSMVLLNRSLIRNMILALDASDRKHAEEVKEMNLLLDYLEIGIGGKYQSFAEFLKSNK